MEKLIEVLPQFITYIILGFVFLRIFRYVSTIKNSDEYEHIIWESILVGFTLKKCFEFIPFSINMIIDTMGMILTTITVAILSAKLFSSKFIDVFLRKIGVYRTRHKYIWQDIEDKDYVTYINAINPNTKEAYYGILKYYEDYEKHPQIVLQSYIYWEDYLDSKTKHDFTNEPEYVVLIDTEKFSAITITYQSESDKVKNKDENKLKIKKSNKILIQKSNDVQNVSSTSNESQNQ